MFGDNIEVKYVLNCVREKVKSFECSRQLNNWSVFQWSDFLEPLGYKLESSDEFTLYWELDDAVCRPSPSTCSV